MMFVSILNLGDKYQSILIYNLYEILNYAGTNLWKRERCTLGYNYRQE